jgi:aspartate aminotransferase
MKFSRLAGSIQSSVTLKINETAGALKAAGEPVIHLGGGEPVTKAPPSAIAAGQKALESGEIRYGPEDGIRPLKEAIVDYMKTWYGLDARVENICVSAGTKQALMVCLQAILEAGDEAIVFAPYWPSYSEMVRICGAEPVILPPGPGLQPSFDALKAAITPRTRAVLLNSPNNPSGVVYDREFVAETVRLCEAKDIWLLVDDIYQRLLFDGAKPLSVYEFSTRKLDDSPIVVLNGVSKAYAMTGFRIGWGVANPALRKAMGSLQGQQTSGPSTLSQQAALAALRGPQDSITSMVRDLEANRTRMVAGLRQIPRVEFATPGGAFYCFPDFSAYQRDSLRMAQELLERVKVVTVPGIAFGLEGHLRMSTCGSARDVEEGLARVRWALDPNSPAETEIGGVRFARTW